MRLSSEFESCCPHNPVAEIRFLSDSTRLYYFGFSQFFPIPEGLCLLVSQNTWSMSHSTSTANKYELLLQQFLTFTEKKKQKYWDKNLFHFNYGTYGHQRLADLLLWKATEHVHVWDLEPCYIYILDYTGGPHELRSLQCKNKPYQIKYYLHLTIQFAVSPIQSLWPLYRA